MPVFSRASREELTSCSEGLQRVFNRVVLTYDCTVICGPRGKAAQNEAYRTGASRREWPNSEHNELPSKAADVAPYPIDWNNSKRFYHFAGFVQAIGELEGVPIRWGGDWDSDRDLDDQTFMDLVHFEEAP